MPSVFRPSAPASASEYHGIVLSHPHHLAACILLAIGAAACVPLEDLGSLSRGDDRAAPGRSESTSLPMAEYVAPADLVVGVDEEPPTLPLQPLAMEAVSGLAPALPALDANEAGAQLSDARVELPRLDATPKVDAASCAGTTFDGVCWYLGAPGESCNQTCGGHGGYREAATSYVGDIEQGGSPEDCAAVLGALGVAQSVRTTARGDDRGVGCHFFGTEDDPWWLSAPRFEAADQLNLARQVCGCAG